jgi:hypothetical protein
LALGSVVKIDLFFGVSLGRTLLELLLRGVCVGGVGRHIGGAFGSLKLRCGGVTKWWISTGTERYLWLRLLLVILLLLLGRSA